MKDGATKHGAEPGNERPRRGASGRRGGSARARAAARIDERARDVTEEVNRALAFYVEKLPDWYPRTLLAIVRNALTSLRGHLENSKDREVTWRSPVAQLRYPAQWDWTRMSWNSGRFAATDLADDRRFQARLIGVVVTHVHLYTLDLLTKGVVEHYDRRGRFRDFMFRADTLKSFEQCSTIDEWKAQVEELVRPLVLDPYRPDLAELLANPRRSDADVFSAHLSPCLRMRIVVEDIPGDAYLAMRVGRLTVHDGTGDAYYPIVSAFGVEPLELPKRKGARAEVRRAFDLARWPQSDRATVLDALHAGLFFSDERPAVQTDLVCVRSSSEARLRSIDAGLASMASTQATILEKLKELESSSRPIAAPVVVRPGLAIGKPFREGGHRYRHVVVSAEGVEHAAMPEGQVRALAAARIGRKAAKDAHTDLLRWMEQHRLPRDPRWITVAGLDAEVSTPQNRSAP